MAFVLLPCDLPTWPTIQRHLGSLKGAKTPSQVTQVLYALHSLCNVAIDPDLNEPVPPDVFAGVEKFLSVEVEQDFFSKTLPAMLEAALRLKDLKPPQGLRYSLQQQHEDVVMERALVTSLLAHIFFCTLPRRSLISHPTLSDPCLAPTLSTLNRESQRVKLKALLHYFKKVSDTSPTGTLTFSRKVMGSKEFLTLKDWMKCEAALCPVEIQHEGRLEDTHPPALLACFTSPDVAQPALTSAKSQQVCAMLSYPEMLATSVFVERLEDNEAMQIIGPLKTATVSNLKNRPHVTFRNNTTPPDLIHALMDADDYRQSEVLQYEEINVLRELNKAMLAFTQPIPEGPMSSFSDIISVSRQLSECSASPPRNYQTRISSGSSLDQSRDDASLEENKKKPKEIDRVPPRDEVAKKQGTSVSKECERTKPVSIGKVKKKVEIVEDKKAVKRNTCDIPDSDIVRSSKHNVDNKLKSLLTKDKLNKEKERVANVQGDTKETAAEQEFTGSPPTAGFVTAPTTLKRRFKRKKDVSAKGCDDVTTQDKIAQAEKTAFAGVQCSKPPVEDLPNNWEESDEEEEETTRLLNRVMRAIQRLEQERPDLVEEVKQDAQQNLGSKPLPRAMGKPPIPDGRPRPLGERDRKERSLGGDSFDRSKRRVGVSGDGRKLSIYVSCSEEAAPEPVADEDHYYSACESLDGVDAPRPRRPSKKRGKKGRRKSSFAERLKEALEREPSLDSCQTQENIPNEEDDPLMKLSRQESAGFVLDTSPRRRLNRKEEKEAEKYGSDISEEDFDDQEEEMMLDRGHEGSDSSRYSFSSDYTSELEDVYEKLGEVLEESEGGNLGPRTAAIARFAHGLLKRALSESYKDVTLGLDGSAVKDPESGSSGPLPIRSLSFSEPRPPASRSVRPPTLNTLKNNLGKPVVTGNWGCGSLRGDHQLKAMIQWAAASKARAPKMAYYTYGDQNTVKLDIVCRLLGDRGWRVGDLVSTLLRYSESRLDSWKRSRETELTESADSSLPESLRFRGPSLDSLTLFDELIGADRPFTTMETEL
ncbi:uncharacterized protein LOC122253204 isoform X2 [Penaeus japonicus]|uniref:uncharacterized protein LOC122253204 isoform X2 n=1 Tax=Penaeus japonicus TaxID=27405 RepID=UPI001C7103C0|nr:uncharacterized protein LOC122253204 isoform X2 [Penaeus japonicus]